MPHSSPPPIPPTTFIVNTDRQCHQPEIPLCVGQKILWLKRLIRLPAKPTSELLTSQRYIMRLNCAFNTGALFCLSESTRASLDDGIPPTRTESSSLRKEPSRKLKVAL
ncbi:hypothetical protein CEXT_264371 [Caerostris extrusa]|uniref:Uncharacterized protein n=1 Tax=Caerostris extrusa TaxID=172846 RepID=A0AAV4RUC1_CAEEX|nr:hypothetical protein CEXT_264371 [Caerostris extrusa]